MRKVKILTDSCADLREDQLTAYGIDYLKMATIEYGVSAPALLTWSREDAHVFYEKLRAGKRILTSQVPATEFREVFEKYLSDGFDIVYIACSSKQSGSVNTGSVIAKKLLEEQPEAYIACIDSLNASTGEGMLAIEAARLAEGGMSAADIEKHILSVRKKVNEYVTVHSLDALRRSGRVKATAAFFGNLMGVKPILIADANGAQAAYKKVKGRQRSLDEIVAMLKASIIDPEEQTLYVAHADCSEDEVNAVVEKLRAEIPCKAIEVGIIGPIIGASVGPDTVGIWGFGEEITYKAGE